MVVKSSFTRAPVWLIVAIIFVFFLGPFLPHLVGLVSGFDEMNPNIGIGFMILFFILNALSPLIIIGIIAYFVMGVFKPYKFTKTHLIVGLNQNSRLDESIVQAGFTNSASLKVQLSNIKTTREISANEIEDLNRESEVVLNGIKEPRILIEMRREIPITTMRAYDTLKHSTIGKKHTIYFVFSVKDVNKFKSDLMQKQYEYSIATSMGQS